MVCLRTICALSLVALGFAGEPSFREDRLHGRRAFVLENDRMRLSTLPGGGFIAEVRFKSEDPRKSVNPMRVPHYQTIDPFEYDEAKHGALYGTDGQRRLQSGYMGHFLCFPQFGAVSDAELHQDLGHHGEAVAVEWKKQRVESSPEGVTLRYSADLPKNQFRVERSITLPADETVAYIEESAENMTMFDRPVNWVQHITFGPPFMEPGRNYVDAPVVKNVLRDGDGVREIPWTTDLRMFPLTPKSRRYYAWLLDRSRPKVYFTMYNPDYPVLIGYIFSSADNPWASDWQENQATMALPRSGKVVARGINVGTTPIAAGLKKSVETGSLFGVPCYRWIQARERLKQTYVIFLAEIPLRYKGVADLQTDNGKIVIVERETGRKMSIKSARPWQGQSRGQRPTSGDLRLLPQSQLRVPRNPQLE